MENLGNPNSMFYTSQIQKVPVFYPFSQTLSMMNKSNQRRNLKKRQDDDITTKQDDKNEDVSFNLSPTLLEPVKDSKKKEDNVLNNINSEFHIKLISLKSNIN